MKVNTGLTIVVVVLGLVLFVEVDSRRSRSSRHWGKGMADAVMRPWEGMLKGMRGPSYRYWHHRKDSNGEWNKRKYGHSDSGSTESRSKSSSRSSSSSRERSPSRSRSESVSSSTSSESGSRLFTSKPSAGEGEGMASQSFIVFVDGHGCSNVTAFQRFLASYNTEVGEAKGRIPPNELMKEMSKLAQDDLFKGQLFVSDGDDNFQCSKTCSTKAHTSTSGLPPLNGDN